MLPLGVVLKTARMVACINAERRCLEYARHDRGGIRVKIKSKVFALSALFRIFAIENREDTNARHKKDCKSFVLLSTFSYLCICNTRIGVNE